MKASRQLLLALVAVVGIAAVAWLVLDQMDHLLGRWFLRVGLPEHRVLLTRWVAAPLVAGLVSGSFAAALFRTKRLVLPLAPALGLALAISASWLHSTFSYRLGSLAVNQEWRALLLCLPLGALLGIYTVRKLYPGRG